MKELTYKEAGAELGVHPVHVRRIANKYPKLITKVVHGYNNIRLVFDVQKVNQARQRDAEKSLKRMTCQRRKAAAR
jgi:hypothetical protein